MGEATWGGSRKGMAGPGWETSWEIYSGQYWAPCLAQPQETPESFLRVSQAEREEGCLGTCGYKRSQSGLIPSRRRLSHLQETFQEQLTLILYVHYQKTVKEETHTKPFTSRAQSWYGDQIRTLQKTNLSCQHRCKNIKKLRSEVINRRKYMSLPSVLRVGLAWQSQWTTLIT